MNKSCAKGYWVYIIIIATVLPNVSVLISYRVFYLFIYVLKKQKTKQQC